LDARDCRDEITGRFSDAFTRISAGMDLIYVKAGPFARNEGQQDQHKLYIFSVEMNLAEDLKVDNGK
jgi:hypothetical protein